MGPFVIHNILGSNRAHNFKPRPWASRLSDFQIICAITP